MAALGNILITCVPTPSGVVSSKYRDGDDSAASPPSTPQLGQPSVRSATEADVPLSVASTGGTAPLAYELSLSTTSSLAGFAVTDSNADFTGDGVYTLTGLTASTQYWVRLATVDAASRRSGYAGVQTFTTPAAGGGDVTAPTAPTNLVAISTTGGQSDLTWTNGTDAIGIAYTDVLRGDSVGGVPTTAGAVIFTVTGTGSSYTDLSAPSGQEVFYRVQHRDAAGNVSLKSDRYFVTIASTELSAIDWYPGHYLSTTGTDMTRAHIDSAATYVNANSHIKGLNIRPYWPEIEDATLGVYDWSIVDYALSKLNTGKKLWLQLQLTKFNTSSTSLNPVVPSYMQNATYSGGGHVEGPKPTNGLYDIDPKIWVSAVMTRLLALITAFGARYNDDARIAGYVIAELQFDLTEGEDDFNGENWVASIRDRYIPGARQALPNKNVIVYMNYINGGVTNKFAIVRDACIANDCVIGAPDTIPCEAGSTGLKVARGVSVTNGLPVHDCRGASVSSANEIGLHCSLQSPDLADGGRYCPTWTGPQYVDWMYNTQRVNFVFWTHFPNETKFQTGLAYVAANPTLYNSLYPSGFA